MKTVDKEKLWDAYQKNPTPQIREQIIIEYAPLVKLVAGRLSMYLGYNVEYEDVPAGALYWLKCLTGGVEERIFTFTDKDGIRFF